MSHFGSQTYEQVLTALRRIIRAVDLHSRTLVQQQGITTPQFLILRELSRAIEMTAGEIARRVNLGQATLTGILDRLEIRGWITRSRCDRDKRRVLVRLTHSGREVLSRAPAPMQDRFVTAFECLPDWEQAQILASLLKVAALMEKTKPVSGESGLARRKTAERNGGTGCPVEYTLTEYATNEEVL